MATRALITEAIASGCIVGIAVNRAVRSFAQVIAGKTTRSTRYKNQSAVSAAGASAGSGALLNTSCSSHQLVPL